MLRISFAVGVLGFIAEFWYLKDYWSIPILIGVEPFSIDDFLCGFAVGGISTGIYDFLFKKRNVPGVKNYKKMCVFLLLFGLGSLILFTNILGYLSILVSISAFLVSALVMYYFRRDLIKPSIITAITITLIMIPIYVILFDVIFVDFWDKYWLLNNTPYGIKVLGNVPLTELVWYFAVGLFLGGAYEFYKGNKKEDIRA